MMATEGPFLAAVIARLADPTINLAAYGVAFAFAILIESPVIMLMSASTALVTNSQTYRKLRNFMHVMNVTATAFLLIVLIPFVYEWLTIRLLGLPPEITRLTYGALWILLPWPSAIGYRRFLHGLLIRAGHTRLLAYGTTLRLGVMILTAISLYTLWDWPGAWIGAASLSLGVTAEALVARIMAAKTLRNLNTNKNLSTTNVDDKLNYLEIVKFYYPLALTSFISLTVQPLLTFLMGRAPSPLESLAVFPVVHSLSFFFRSFGLSYQEVALAVLQENRENFPRLARFALWLGLATSLGIASIAFTPFTIIWFEQIAGLRPELTGLASTSLKILVPVPALSVFLSFLRSIYIQARMTSLITTATVVEVLTLAILFILLGWTLDMPGVIAAFSAFLGGRLAGVLFLLKDIKKCELV
jgi:Na+-driven multidrug efflux pump|tara:strand:+ start:2902 stop:4146 length:1245 start_codon:yes stop_codon:yes gene_type:complete